MALTIDQTIELVEMRGYVVLDKAELMQHYAELRELSEGRGAHHAAAERSINYLFEALGEPGAGE